MSALLFSTHDIRGGAARAAYRLHRGLRCAGVSSTLVVQQKESDDASVHGPQSPFGRGWARARCRLEHLPLYFYRDRQDVPFHVQWLPDRLERVVQNFDPDIIHLHWTCKGFLQIETISSFNRPIIWTLHDMWAMTGGCHYSGACDRYTIKCGKCPQLGSGAEADLSWLTWWRKYRAWKSLNITFVTPSQWLAECARSSSLLRSFRTEVIPYGLDLNVYKPVDGREARRLLDLPSDARLVLFGAMNATSNPRKGFDLLLEALVRLSATQSTESIELVVFGASRPQGDSEFPYRTHYLGNLTDHVSLAALYSAADVFVAPSREDNLPLTVQESLACGTPVVAFDIGGMKDMIVHKTVGYLADPFDANDLSRGIEWSLDGVERRRRMSAAARRHAEEHFSSEKQAESYCKLYQEAIAND